MGERECAENTECHRIIQTLDQFDEFADDFGGQKRDFIENTAGVYEQKQNVDDFQHRDSLGETNWKEKLLAVA